MSQIRKKWIWSSMESGDLSATTETAYSDDMPVCPVCGHEPEYVEGQIGQDFMGNDSHGWWYSCFTCGLSTQSHEID